MVVVVINQYFMHAYVPKVLSGLVAVLFEVKNFGYQWFDALVHSFY